MRAMRQMLVGIEKNLDFDIDLGSKKISVSDEIAELRIIRKSGTINY